MDEKLIVIAVDSFASAQVLQTYLEANGIKCFLQNVNLVQSAVSDGVKVQIKESDAERALKLISKVKLEQEAVKVVNPRKILVPVDFSQPSENAAYFALGLAHKYGAEIKLLHVFNSPIIDLIPFSDVTTIQIDIDVSYHILHKNAKEQLLKFHAKVKSYANQHGMGDVRVGYALREGVASYGITEMSNQYKPSFIVMGTKGEGFRNTELVGSVAKDVLESTRIPVLSIPESAKMVDSTQVGKVLYATRFDDYDFMAIRKLMNIVSPFSAQIHCVNVSSDADSSLAKAKMASLETYFKRVARKTHVICEIVEGKNMVETFTDYVKENGIDLIAITTQKRNLIYKIFNPSLSRRLLFESDIPVLMFHA